MRSELTFRKKIGLFLFVAVATGGASAQISTNASCLSTFLDLYNSKGQSPCLVGAYLGAACNGGLYTVPALNNGSHYVGLQDEGENDPCLCSTVMYSVMSACGACQGDDFVSWQGWSAACPTVFVTSFPGAINPDTAVPGWAYENVTVSGTFNVTTAMSDDSPESTAIPQSTAANGSPTSVSGGSSGSSHHSSDTGAVVGGVVGGVVGLSVIALLAIFFVRRRAKSRASSGNLMTTEIASSYGHNENSEKQEPYQVITPLQLTSEMPPSPVRVTTVTQIPRLYNPDDPSTFPTYPNPQSQPPVPFVPHAQTPSASEGFGYGYTGVPEV